MTPWSYEEIQSCKAILYPEEGILPTTLLDQVFKWYGGVPRYVLSLASAGFITSGGNEHAVLHALVAELTQAITTQDRGTDIIYAHWYRTRDGEYSHRVLHIQLRAALPLYGGFESTDSQSSKNVVSLSAGPPMTTGFSPAYPKQVLQAAAYSGMPASSNMLKAWTNAAIYMHLCFESYAHAVLQDGGTLEVCQLCGDLPSDQNEERVTFPAAESQFFRAYKDILDLMGTNVLWQSAKKYLPSVKLLRGPATRFQVTVWETQHIMQASGPSAMLSRWWSASPNLARGSTLRFASNLYLTYQAQQYLTKDSQLIKGPPEDVVITPTHNTHHTTQPIPCTPPSANIQLHLRESAPPGFDMASTPHLTTHNLALLQLAYKSSPI
ncbi:hypothetical protein PCANC_10080 [Puccinia coronata f. sp. avenae]|uniref:Uncharacterized protein n=1 Tax=Puccinia coronata f. sp. avenae TaxID=200324 RepID=A0A2N5V0R0_9BASI|nr:hypothetical protein PCANC_10080 [Puccinia coronata f. sp. avenae]